MVAIPRSMTDGIIEGTKSHLPPKLEPPVSSGDNNTIGDLTSAPSSLDPVSHTYWCDRVDLAKGHHGQR